MNEEKKIAETVLDAIKMRKGSYVEPSGNGGIGGYKYDMEFCLIECCKKNGLSENLWALLDLAMHYQNDLVFWAEDVLADRKTLDQMSNLGKECFFCEELKSKDVCEQCQETGLANPLNH